MVEDEAHDAALVEHALKDGGFDFAFKRVDTEEDFLKELQSFHPSVILSDHGLPVFDGFAALAIAQNKLPTPHGLVRIQSRLSPGNDCAGVPQASQERGW